MTPNKYKGCPSCGQVMKVRDGKFGKFYFCLDQHICGQKTITVRSEEQEMSYTSCNPDIDIMATSSEPLVYEMRVLEAEQGPLFSLPEEPFVDELGNSICENGEDYRPYG